ncbi:hypothetical protein BG005_008630 [Podila minutissima]|nr:hypothetical protein BG005_008630 [Podila minutissima]
MDTNQLEVLSLKDNMETTTLYIFVDEARYLEIVTMVAPLRSKYLVEPFMISNENMAVNPDSDNIVGLSGILDRVCHAIQGFLKDLVPCCEFFVWKLCVLSPPEIQVGLVESHSSYSQTYWSESSTPGLNGVLSHQYGPVYGKRTEKDHIEIGFEHYSKTQNKE